MGEPRWMTDDEFDVAVKVALAEKQRLYGTHFPFTDQNCDDCAGWDGESDRCQCGNRRVSWADQCNGTVNAEAY